MCTKWSQLVLIGLNWYGMDQMSTYQSFWVPMFSKLSGMNKYIRLKTGRKDKFYTDTYPSLPVNMLLIQFSFFCCKSSFVILGSLNWNNLFSWTEHALSHSFQTWTGANFIRTPLCSYEKCKCKIGSISQQKWVCQVWYCLPSPHETSFKGGSFGNKLPQYDYFEQNKSLRLNWSKWIQIGTITPNGSIIFLKDRNR